MRRSLIVALVLILALCAGVSLFWLRAADQLAAGIEDWRREQQSKGYGIVYQGPEVSGFPGRLQAQILEPHVTSPRDWSWDGPKLTGAASLFDPFTIDLDFPGQHRFHGVHRDKPWAGELAAAAAIGKVELEPGGRLNAARVELADVLITGEKLLPVRLGQFSASVAQAASDRVKSGAAAAAQSLIELSTTAKAIDLPAGQGGPFGDSIESVTIETTLVGTLPQGKPEEALPAWRDSGGYLLLRRSLLAWGDVQLRAQGRLQLDAELRPEGEFTALVSGVDNTVDTLVELGVLKPEAGFGVRLALAALGKRRQIDGRSAIELPVILRRGRLYLGPVPLLRVPPIL